MRRRHRGHALLLATLLGAAGVSTFTVSLAGAQTGGNLQQQAQQLAAQISATGTKLDAVNEQVNGAMYQLQQSNTAIADDEARIAAAKAQTDALEHLVQARAVSIYQSASNGSDTTIFSVDPSELASSQKYTQAASDQDNTLVDQLNVSKAELSAREKEAQNAKLQAQKDVAALQAAQAALHAQETQLEALNGQVQGQLVSLVAQAQAQAQATQAPTNVGPIPAVGGGAGQAVAYARAQLGRCYATGGTGNPCFDCSGLTMMAWGSAGVGMSHFSGAQYNEFPHVPMSALQPGDLVFTADPGQHVGIYIGGGTAIHASNPGNNPNAVREIGVGYFSLAARP